MNETETVKKALESAYANLENNRLLINSLNVFPVPDGDTGDNMCMTFKSGLDKIKQKEYKNPGEMIADFALACLMGARGNSGVILSLAAKGFSDAAHGKQSGGAYLKNGLKNAVELCYKSVSSPKEGTALTVLRACSDKAAKVSVTTGDFKKVFAEVYATAVATLTKTKELLPELKEANVVDAGAKGLVCVMEGIRLVAEENKAYERGEQRKAGNAAAGTKVRTDKTYCCEFIIKSEKELLPSELEFLGDSAISVAADGIVKIHVHSNFPDRVLSFALGNGELVNFKAENMRLQHKAAGSGKPKKYAVIAVSPGGGITECFRQLGCDKIIESSIKVSAGQALSAAASLHAGTVFLLPNDKNNFLAFKQAVKMADKNCIMIETEDFAEGISAMTVFDESLGEDENAKNMLEAASDIKTGKICIADKTVKKIKKGDSIGIIGNKIEVRAEDTFSCMEKVVEKLCDRDYNDISVFCGSSVGETDFKKVGTALGGKYREAQVNVIQGDQSVYDYVVMIK